MSYVKLPEAKHHLAVIHNLDDALIQDCIDDAESYAASFMGRRSIEGPQACPWLVGDDCGCLSGDDSEPSSEPAQPVPGAVRRAILLLVGDYYENRTAAVTGTIVTQNPAAEALMHFHRVGLGV